MNPQDPRLGELRELFLAAPESTQVQIMAWIAAGSLFVLVAWLVRRRSLTAEYTPIWMGLALGLVVASVDLTVLRALARTLGAWTLSSTVFFLGEVFLVAICLNYAVRISQTGLRVRKLAQETAILRGRLEELEARGRPDGSAQLPAG
ncbi:DUF2304 family protein [Myxococcota bacterium]|nr:DUF2304 family protein [Myxococcota bacterium]MCZ7617491.1 DUF2304 domain-containing protein [Myxococcota bacterium]